MAIVPPSLLDWVPRRFALNVKKCGVHAKFPGDLAGDNSVVERGEYWRHYSGCVAYTATPLPLGQVWQITILGRSKKRDSLIPIRGRKWWNYGLKVGVTTTIPDNVPCSLPTKDARHYEWTYSGKTLFHNLSSIELSYPNLDDGEEGNKVGLLISSSRELHLFFDDKHVCRLATGLPVENPIFGGVDVQDSCFKIKSEILSGESKLSSTSDPTTPLFHSTHGVISSDQSLTHAEPFQTACESNSSEQPSNPANEDTKEKPTIGKCPDLLNLLGLKIPETIGVDYEIFGINLLEDRTGSRVDIIVDDCHKQSEKIIIRILKEWLKGGGKPVTWQAFIDTLRDCKHTNLADKIQKSINM